MKFEEVLPALKEGKKIKRKCMPDGYYHIDNNHIYDEIGQLYTFGVEADILQDDWEIVEEKKKVKLRNLTEKQYLKWFNANCCSRNNNKRMSDCFDCIFHNVVCNPELSRCWVEHKDLYSDKFLDQEIEIEEE